MKDNEKENKTNVKKVNTVKKETTKKSPVKKSSGNAKKTTSKTGEAKPKTVKKETVKKNSTPKKITKKVEPEKENIVKEEKVTETVEEVKENIKEVANETAGVVDSIGKTIDDGLNKLDEKISSMEKVNLTVEVPKDKNVINNIIALFVTFIMFNVKWIKYKIEFFGYESSTSITVLHTDMFDLSFMFGLAKICAIFAILLFFVNIVNTFIKLEEHIPSLKKYNLDKYLPLGYYGLYLVSLFLTLIGVLFTKYSYFTLGYIITVIIYIVAMYVTFKGDLKKNEKDIK
mgnify:FL=1